MKAKRKKPCCKLCDIQKFLEGMEWKLFERDRIIMNYAKEPEVDGHIVVQPRDHAEMLSELGWSEWKQLAELIWLYSTAVVDVLNERFKEEDRVEKVYVYCLSEAPHSHLHFHIKPRLKSVKTGGPCFINWVDPRPIVKDESHCKELVQLIKKRALQLLKSRK